MIQRLSAIWPMQNRASAPSKQDGHRSNSAFMAVLLLLSFLCAFSFLPKLLASEQSGTIVNLVQQSWYVKQGFDPDLSRTDNRADFIKIERNFPLLLNQIFDEPLDGQLSQYTIEVYFNLEANRQLQPLGLYLEQIGEGWQVYLNGNLLRDELFLNAAATELLYNRYEKEAFIAIPDRWLQTGTNKLSFRIAGYHPTTPFNPNNLNGLGRFTYEIRSVDSMVGKSWSLRPLMVPIILATGFFLIVIFLRIKEYAYFLSMGLMMLTVGMHYNISDGLLNQIIFDRALVLKFQYMSMMPLQPCLLFFLHDFFFPGTRLSPHTKWITILSVLLFFGVLFGTLQFAQGLIRIWQFMTVYMLVEVFLVLSKALRLRKRSAVNFAMMIFLTLLTGFAEISKTVFNLPIQELSYLGTIALVIGVMTVLINDLVHKQQTAKLLNIKLNQEKQAISRFVPIQILRFLDRQSITDIKLGDQVERRMSVMFVDIRGFTRLSESMTPQENFNFLNSYLGRVGPIVRKNNGFIDKYIGDGLMALFPGEPEEAVKAAIDLQHEVRDYNRMREDYGYQPIQVGIGLHHGMLMLGTIGERMRMDGTVISDAVNFASRIETLTKQFEASILVSQAVISQVAHPPQGLRFLGPIPVPGKEIKMGIYELFENDSPDLFKGKLRSRELFEQGITAYYGLDFSTAHRIFSEIAQQNPDDRTCQYFLRRAADESLKDLSKDPLAS